MKITMTRAKMRSSREALRSLLEKLDEAIGDVPPRPLKVPASQDGGPETWASHCRASEAEHLADGNYPAAEYHRGAAEAFERCSEARVPCSVCGKSVSTPVPKGTVVRAWVECPECVAKRPHTALLVPASEDPCPNCDGVGCAECKYTGRGEDWEGRKTQPVTGEPEWHGEDCPRFDPKKAEGSECDCGFAPVFHRPRSCA